MDKSGNKEILWTGKEKDEPESKGIILWPAFHNC